MIYGSKITQEKAAELVENAMKIVKEWYGNPHDFNVTLFTDGDEVTRTTHHGSIDYRGIQCELYLIQSQDMMQYESDLRENLTDSQVKRCDEKGWLTCKDSASENPQKWDDDDEFTIDDDDWSSIESEIESKISDFFEID